MADVDQVAHALGQRAPRRAAELDQRVQGRLLDRMAQVEVVAEQPRLGGRAQRQDAVAEANGDRRVRAGGADDAPGQVIDGGQAGESK